MGERIKTAAEKRKYKWPWVVLAAVGLGIVLAIVWMALKVQEIREQRDPMRYQQNWNDGNLKVVQGVQRILIF